MAFVRNHADAQLQNTFPVTSPFTSVQYPITAHSHYATTRLRWQFRKMYERGDIPASIVHGVKNTLNWRTPLDKLDYHRFLPVFFEGIREREEPYRFLAVKVNLDYL